MLLKTETPDQVLTFNLQDYRKVLANGTTQVTEDGTFFMQGCRRMPTLCRAGFGSAGAGRLSSRLCPHDEVTPWHDRWR